MKYYLNASEDYIDSLSTGSGDLEITESKYNEILSIISSYPKDAPSGFVYRLKTATLEWELVELPPMPEPEDELTDEEALAIILGGGDA